MADSASFKLKPADDAQMKKIVKVGVLIKVAVKNCVELVRTNHLLFFFFVLCLQDLVGGELGLGAGLRRGEGDKHPHYTSFGPLIVRQLAVNDPKVPIAVFSCV